MKKGKSKFIFFIITICLLVFQNLLQSIIKPMQYFDEALSLLSIPVLLLYYLKNKGNGTIKKYNMYMLILMAVLLGAGLFSTINYNYQPINFALSDALLVSKFFLAYLLSQLLFQDGFIKQYENKIYKITKVIIVVLFLLTISNYIFKIWPSQDFRFGLMTNQLFYSHPTYLAAICIFLLALLTLSSNKKLNIFYIALIYVMLLSTLRFKAIGASIIILCLLLYLKHADKKVSVSKLGLLAVIAIVLAWDQISYYYIDLDGSARKVLNITSIKIAKDYFPIGAGFATFGSYFSSVNYSPLYMKYGINKVYGLEAGKANFMTDTFWPMIIGQFGVIGTVCYFMLLLLIFIKIQMEYSKDNKELYISKLICFCYLLISSTSESAFVNPISIPLAIVIGINIITKRKGERET